MDNIFTFWWQGFENAPDIVKVCQNSLLRMQDPNLQKLHVLDQSNVFDYVEIPGYIMDKHKAGIISTTHLSDIIRSMLLRNYGGLWTDATIYFTRPLNHNMIFEQDFFTLKNPSAMRNDITSLWECFLIAGKCDFPLFDFLIEFWLDYWKKENHLITYLLTDHIFYVAYNENARVREAIDNCPSFTYKLDYFEKQLNSKFDNAILEAMKNEPFIKMSYKFPLRVRTEEGCLTYYGKLLEDSCKK